MQPSHPSKKIIYSCITALAIALILLITIILPAEYGYDPLKTGDALGLTALSKSKNNNLEINNKPLQQDKITLSLFPFESVEYKYYMQAGDTLVYEWHANGDAVYDMHVDPDNGGAANETSYAKGRSSNKKGVYRAEFSGIHGWWWQNRSTEEITIHLKSAGFYTYAKEMRDGFNKQYNFNHE